MRYLPANKERAQAFEENMGKNLLYRSTDNFIAIYNNNLINKSNDEIDNVAKAITEVYKNVSLINKQFIVKSPEEVIAEEFALLLPHMSFVATLKRIAENIMESNFPEDSKFVFTESNKNTVMVFDPSTSETVVFEGAERLRDANKSISINPFLINNISFEPYGDDGDGVMFGLQEVLNMDTSFIRDIGELLEAYVSNV